MAMPTFPVIVAGDRHAVQEIEDPGLEVGNVLGILKTGSPRNHTSTGLVKSGRARAALTR